MRPFLLAITLFTSWATAQTGTPGTPGARSQSPAPRAGVTPIRTSLPSEFELLRTRYRFENDGTGRKEVVVRIRILNKMGVLQRGELTFDYKPLSERLEIPYVRVVKEDGRRVVNITKGEMVQHPNIRAQPAMPVFDYDEKRVQVPGLHPGDALEYEVVTVLWHPLAQGQFWAQYNFQPSVVLDEQLEIDVPTGRAVKVKAKPGIESSVSGDSKTQIYRWRSLNPTLEDPRSKSDPWHEPPDVQMSSFANWEEVGRWYAELEKSRRAPTPEVRAKADQLTQGLHTEMEKVEALYNFTAKRIKYLSLLSLGVGGFVPSSADEVLRKGNGDCKDKVVLLAALLEAEGVHASSVLVNPSRKLDPDVPSPWPFTHIITMLNLGKDEIWMDPSPAVLPFRMLEYQVRKKQGLVMPPDGVPHFEETPADAPVPNNWQEEIDGRVSENGTLDATVSITASGDAELSLRQAFLAPIESVRPLTVHGTIKGLDRTDQISDVKIGDPTDTYGPFILSFRVSKPLHFDFSKGAVEFKLPLSDFRLPSAEGNGFGEWHRADAEPVALGPPGERTYKIRLELAQTLKPEIPPDFVLERDYGVYRSSYKLDGNFVTAERKLITHKDELPSNLAEDYRAFRQKVLAESQQSVLVEVARDTAEQR